jgi:transcription factor SFP1
MNGLKYHLEKVHLPHESASLDDLLANAKKVTFNPNKPFACDVCGKRYKNANGMKYHIEHTHAGVDSTL